MNNYRQSFLMILSCPLLHAGGVCGERAREEDGDEEVKVCECVRIMHFLY